MYLYKKNSSYGFSFFVAMVSTTFSILVAAIGLSILNNNFDYANLAFFVVLIIITSLFAITSSIFLMFFSEKLDDETKSTEGKIKSLPRLNSSTEGCDLHIRILFRLPKLYNAENSKYPSLLAISYGELCILVFDELLSEETASFINSYPLYGDLPVTNFITRNKVSEVADPVRYRDLIKAENVLDSVEIPDRKQIVIPREKLINPALL